MFKTLNKVFRTALSAGLMAGAAASAAFAGQYVGGDLNLNLNEDDDVLIVAADVVANGQVRGDVTVFGADIELDINADGEVQIIGADISLNGLVRESVEVAGADIHIGANLLSDLEAAGADVTINGAIAGDASIAGAMLVFNPDSVVGGLAKLGGRELIIEGRLENGAEISSRSVTIRGELNGPVEIRARDVTIDASAVINGPLTVRAPKPPHMIEGAQIGEINYIEESFDDDYDFDGPDVHIGLDDFDLAPSPWAASGVLAASAFLLGLLAALASPRGVSKVAASFRSRPWVSGLLGLVVLAVLPVLTITLFVLLLVTVIGIPLAFLLIFALPIVIFLAFAFGGVAIGDLALNRSGEPAGFGLRAGSFLAALLVIALLSAIPVLGFIIMPIVLCIGLGAWTLAIFARTTPSAQTRGAAEI